MRDYLGGLREDSDSLCGGVWRIMTGPIRLVLGGGVTDFRRHAETSAFYIPYDWVYVAGWWNSSNLSVF